MLALSHSLQREGNATPMDRHGRGDADWMVRCLRAAWRMDGRIDVRVRVRVCVCVGGWEREIPAAWSVGVASL